MQKPPKKCHNLTTQNLQPPQPSQPQPSRDLAMASAKIRTFSFKSGAPHEIKNDQRSEANHFVARPTTGPLRAVRPTQNTQNERALKNVLTLKAYFCSKRARFLIVKSSASSAWVEIQNRPAFQPRRMVKDIALQIPTMLSHAQYIHNLFNLPADSPALSLVRS